MTERSLPQLTSSSSAGHQPNQRLVRHGRSYKIMSTCNFTETRIGRACIWSRGTIRENYVRRLVTSATAASQPNNSTGCLVLPTPHPPPPSLPQYIPVQCMRGVNQENSSRPWAGETCSSEASSCELEGKQVTAGIESVITRVE